MTNYYMYLFYFETHPRLLIPPYFIHISFLYEAEGLFNKLSFLTGSVTGRAPCRAPPEHCLLNTETTVGDL